MFAEPVAEATSKGVLLSSKIKRSEYLKNAIDELGTLYQGQDILLETFLSGREITVGILGTGEDARVLGANEYVYRKLPPSEQDAVPERRGNRAVSMRPMLDRIRFGCCSLINRRAPCPYKDVIHREGFYLIGCKVNQLDELILDLIKWEWELCHM